MEEIIVIIRYYSFYSNEPKKLKLNAICYPYFNNIYNFNFINKIKKNEKNFIDREDRQKVSDWLRFSNGPYYFEKPTHLIITTEAALKEHNYFNDKICHNLFTSTYEKPMFILK